MGDYYLMFTPCEIEEMELDFEPDLSAPWDWPVEDEPLVSDCD